VYVKQVLSVDGQEINKKELNTSIAPLLSYMNLDNGLLYSSIL